jgi:hypothetical protein
LKGGEHIAFDAVAKLGCNEGMCFGRENYSPQIRLLLLGIQLRSHRGGGKNGGHGREYHLADHVQLPSEIGKP